MWHIQAPIYVLNSMVTLRLHLDNTNQDNGCLLAIANSHQMGRVKHAEISQLVKQEHTTPCIAGAGESLVMRPHIIHSSKKAIAPSRRRIIHLEYSSYKLPVGINWA